MKPLPIFRRNGMTLVPANPEAVSITLKVKDGDRCVFERRQPRNLEHHRKLFGIFKAIIEATGKWHSPEALLDDVMVALGKGVAVTNQLTGEVYWKRDSIAFESMSQADFEPVYAEIMALLTDRLGFDPEILLPERQRLAA